MDLCIDGPASTSTIRRLLVSDLNLDTNLNEHELWQ